MFETLTYFFYFILFYWQRFWSEKRPIPNAYEASEGPNEDEIKRELLNKQEEKLLFQGTSGDTSIFIEIHIKKECITANLLLIINGKKYTLPNRILRTPRWTSTPNLLNIGPLRVELREAFRRWRITFRGDLKDSYGELRFISIQSFWTALSDPYWFMQEIPINLLARCASDYGLYKRLKNIEDFFQWGMFRSRIIVEDLAEEFDLRGFRLRTNSCLERLTTLFMQNGDRTLRLEIVFSNRLSPLEFGLKFGGDGNLTQLNFSVDEEVEHVALHSLKLDDTLTSNLEISRLINGHGDGFTWFVDGKKEPKERDVIKQYGYQASESDRAFTTLPFTHRACMDSKLSGGKGSNLAILTGLQHKYIVPSGLVITTTAFHHHLKNSEELWKFLKSLELYDNEHIQDFDTIEKTMNELFNQTTLNEQLKEEIETQLEFIFCDRLNQIRFAVRSSAVGEDSADLSSAGQLESYLHVDLKSVPLKIIECWKSNFRREVMSYRFENGQNLTASMAVVIQEMIVDGIAGVMFTNDPIKGDPSKMVLNLIEGDGEMLVSGHVNPSQVVISKRNMSIVETSGKQLLNKEECLKLANVGIILENAFGHAQDVEFVCRSGRIYVVQSRNITNLDIESDWEIKHEFDSPLLSTQCLMTTVNVGEVLSVPLYALDCSTTGVIYDRILKSIFQYMQYHPIPVLRHVSTAFPIYRQRVFFEMVEAMLRNWENIERDRIPEYNIAGTEIFTKETIEFGRNRFPPKSTTQKIYEVYMVNKVVFFDSWHYIKKVALLMEEIKLCTIPNDINGIFNAIKTQRYYMMQILDSHTKLSLFANIGYAVLAMILRGSAEGEVSSQLLNAIGTIYSNNPEEIISTDISLSLKNLARSIKSNANIYKKLTLSAKEVIEYLRKDESECGQLFRQFILKHGHRGSNELLISATPYIRAHEELISAIMLIMEDQNLNKSTQREVINDIDNLIDKLDIGEISRGKRLCLKFFIPHAHRGVAFREVAKNYLVNATFMVRNAYWNLAKQMHKKKLISRPELLFHLTIQEIEQLIQGPNSQLLARARRRKNAYESQAEAIYPYISIGSPTPLPEKVYLNTLSDLKLHGTVACGGKVIGRARVVFNLIQARETKNGEILITKSTDIAWSPLFPILKGLVTEIGGLLSHGAVVAREYSLPCLIAVENATSTFKTGDKVLLDATKGTIERLDDNKSQTLS